MRVSHWQDIQPHGPIERFGTLTGEVSEAGMLRVVWDADGFGVNGWLAPGSFEEEIAS